jgi:hypothetical protein
MREARELGKTSEGRAMLEPANGAVAITPEMLKLGRETFYQQSFGNEIPLTEVLGLLDGPLTAADFAVAIAELGGKGTTNLRVRLSRNATVAGKKFRKGMVIDTGLDVPNGAATPLGMVMRPGPHGLRAGISCAACHSTVDPQTFQIIHGAPNTDLQAGLILALASNSASFFAHADIEELRPLMKDPKRTVIASNGKRVPLPDPQALEDAVDAAFLKWPPGTFDSMLDLRGDPTQFPTAYTRESYPYGWSGFSSIGPFRGLSSLNNNLHGLNSDPLTVADCSPALFHLDKEVYLAIVLQNAPAGRFRFDPAKEDKPSEFLVAADPTPGATGLNHVVALPIFPKGSLASPNGLWVSAPGFKVWEQINALSAWQNTLIPPRPKSRSDEGVARRGRAVFDRAGCTSCHGGPALTDHRIIPVEEIKTEPVRAQAFRRAEGTFADPVGYAFDQPVPLPANSRTLAIPTSDTSPDQVDLAMAWKGTSGGYKVPALVGLAWSAPYLHDGGVAVGPNEAVDLGIPGTLKKNVAPDARLSLKALIDRKLRARVVAANGSDPELIAMNVRGIGHEFWVDQAGGFTSEEQASLVSYLLGFVPE